MSIRPAFLFYSSYTFNLGPPCEDDGVFCGSYVCVSLFFLAIYVVTLTEIFSFAQLPFAQKNFFVYNIILWTLSQRCISVCRGDFFCCIFFFFLFFGIYLGCSQETTKKSFWGINATELVINQFCWRICRVNIGSVGLASCI